MMNKKYLFFIMIMALLSIIAYFHFTETERHAVSTHADNGKQNPLAETTESSLPDESGIIDFLNAYKAIHIRYLMIMNDRPEAMEEYKNTGEKPKIKGASTFDELAQLLEKSFYPDAWTSGNAYEDTQSLLTPGITALIRAALKDEAHEGYLLLFPPPAAKAISGHQTGKFPNNWYSDYELIATPSVYGGDTSRSYFISSHQEGIRWKDMGQPTADWSCFEKERPLLPGGGWEDLMGAKPSNNLNVEEKEGYRFRVLQDGKTRKEKLSHSEEMALGKLMAFEIAQKNDGKNIPHGNGDDENRIYSMLSEINHPNAGTESNPGKVLIDEDYLFFIPPKNKQLLDGKENVEVKNFVLIATPAKYPKSGKHTFYLIISDSGPEYYMKDAGVQLGSWLDVMTLQSSFDAKTWGKIIF